MAPLMESTVFRVTNSEVCRACRCTHADLWVLKSAGPRLYPVQGTPFGELCSRIVEGGLTKQHDSNNTNNSIRHCVKPFPVNTGLL